MRVVDEQFGEGHRLVLTERHLALQTGSIESSPRVEVVELNRLETLRETRVDHRLEVDQRRHLLGRGADVDEVLAAPVRIVT